MDYSDEAYVRLYTRDTTNWRRMGWDGQNVCMQLLRKVDRAGALELSGLEPWEAVKLAINGPEDAVRRGVETLLDLGTLVVVGDLLVFPNHIEAQTAVRSDKLRQKESRERRALGIGVSVTNRDAQSRGVTAPSREQPVSDGQSQPVTPRHSLLNSAVHSSTQIPPARAGESAAPEPHAQPPEPEPTADPSPEPFDPAIFETGAYVQAFRDKFFTVAGEMGFRSPPEPTHSQARAGARRSGQLARAEKRPFDECAAELSRAALHAQLTTGRGAGLHLLEVQPGAQGPPPRAKAGRVAPSRGTTTADFGNVPSLAEQRKAAANGKG